MLDIDVKDRGEQRKFGIVMAVAIAVLGCIRYALHSFEHVPTNFFLVAAVFLVLGVAIPIALQPVFYLWIKFAIVLNWIMTRVFLTVAFYLILTPISVFIRFGADPLKRQWKGPEESYWDAPEDQPEEFERYKQQF